MVISVRALAKTIDHALLQPSLTMREFDAGCDLALRHDVAAICVKSADVGRAVYRTRSSDVLVCAVVGFPHGNVGPSVMSFEAARALDDGAREIDMVVNPSRVLSEDWSSVRELVEAVNATVTGRSGWLKVIFETGLIRSRESKIRLCAICREANVAFVKTSTGFAFTKNADGSLTSVGATLEDVALLVEHAGQSCRVKASGGIRTLQEALAYIQAGAARLGTTSTEDILREAAASLNAE